MVYDANGFTDAAIVTYRQARLLDSRDMRWPYLEGLALSVQGRIDEAIHAMNMSIQIDSSYLPAHLAKGYWLIDLGEFRDACTTFEKAETESDADEQTIALHLGRAQCQLELGEIEKAVQAIDSLPSTGLPAYAELLRTRINRANDDSTRTETKRMESGDSGQLSWPDPIAGAVVEYTRGLSNEALLVQKLIDGGRAEDALNLVISLRERHLDVTYLIELHSATLIALDRHEEAITVLQDGVRRYPHEHLLHFNLGLLLDALGQRDAALDHYGYAIEYQVDFVPAYDATASLLMTQARNGSARDVLEASLAYRNPDATTFYRLGVLAGGDGDWQQSATYLTQANSLDPENVAILSGLALSLGELGRQDAAKDAIRLALDIAPDNVKVERAVETLIANGILQSVP